MHRQLTILLFGAAILAGCAKQEPPVRSVTEFVENPILLEAAMVRCSRDRAASRYDPECMNVREAVDIVESREEEIRRAELEAESEAKRRALRRTLEAQAEARRRAELEAKRRREAEYLAQFGVLPPDADGAREELPEGNVPLAVVPESDEQDARTPARNDTLPATDGGNASGSQAEPVEEETTDLQDVREELRRRGEDDDGPY
jgi:hypothetical protein